MQLLRLTNLKKSTLYCLDRIVSIEGNGNYSRLNLVDDGTTEFYCIQLTKLEKVLSDNFFRINRNIIINTSYVKCYTNAKPISITMTNNEICSVSFRRCKPFKQKMDQKILFWFTLIQSDTTFKQSSQSYKYSYLMVVWKVIQSG
jgi:DNA-binding LytR/AlgR family response regulator